MTRKETAHYSMNKMRMNLRAQVRAWCRGITTLQMENSPECLVSGKYRFRGLTGPEVRTRGGGKE